MTRAGIYPPPPVIGLVGIVKPCKDWYASLLFILAQHISLKGKVICEAGLVGITPVHPHCALLHGEQEGPLVLRLKMSLPDEIVKGVKGDYHIFNSSGELQQEVAEHSISKRGSSSGSALWPSSTLWRYALFFWLLCAACCSHNLLLVSAILIAPHSTTFLPSAPSFVFLPAHLFFCCSLPPYFSHCFSLSVKNKLFFFFFSGTSILMLLRLPSHFLTLSSLSLPVWSVSMLSSIKSPMLNLPESHFPPQCGQVIFG